MENNVFTTPVNESFRGGLGPHTCTTEAVGCWGGEPSTVYTERETAGKREIEQKQSEAFDCREGEESGRKMSVTVINGDRIISIIADITVSKPSYF